jgi:hypothetical protein
VLAAVVGAGMFATACSGGDGGGGEAVSAGGGEDGPVADDGTRRELASGSDGPSTAGEIVATSAEEWREKWAASGATIEAPDVGGVDFSAEVAVGIFAGERPTGGWKIDPAVEVKTQGRFAAVAYAVVGPGEGCQSTQALTSPYLVLAVKGEAVRFEREERKEPCD